MEKYDTLDMLIPVGLRSDPSSSDAATKIILEEYHKYGFTHFMLCCPGASYRSVGYISKEEYHELAKRFMEVKEKLSSYPIKCGWWVCATLKSGRSPEFSPVIKTNGDEHPFANCCLDENFRKRFSQDVAEFAAYTKPDFIITEDDFSLSATDGCFCKHHLDAFSEKQGRYYSREELTEILSQRTPEAMEIIKSWREVLKESQVGFARAIRTELDKKTPEIPAGFCQAGGADVEGNCTVEVSKTLAGPNHVPFSRLMSGGSYAGIDSKLIPEMQYFSLYTKQHINIPFRFYHESDAYPHTRYYSAGSQMKTIMGTAYSYGFDGSIYQTKQLLDGPYEETIYGRMFASERARFNEVNRIAKRCTLKGVNISYDPFLNTAREGRETRYPSWVRCISRFGIPYTTLESDVAFWDTRQVKYADDEVLKKALSKGLFVDGDAAKILCKRGYGKYLGVDIGEEAVTGTMFQYDFGAREIICDEFADISTGGRQMPSPSTYAPGGNGLFYKMTVTNEKCKVVTELRSFRNELISPAMTIFENEIGGKVVVMGMTISQNNSQSLFNYRRRDLLQHLLSWCSKDFAYVKYAPDVFLIVNEANEPDKDGFKGMLTVINLCPDEVDEVNICLPEKWNNCNEFYMLDIDADWQRIEVERKVDSVTIKQALKYLEPMYIMMK